MKRDIIRIIARHDAANDFAPATEGPGETMSDIDIVAGIFLKLKAMYAKDGGALPDPMLKLTWPYRITARPAPEELLQEISGKALADPVCRGWSAGTYNPDLDPDGTDALRIVRFLTEASSALDDREAPTS